MKRLKFLEGPLNCRKAVKMNPEMSETFKTSKMEAHLPRTFDL